MIFILQNLYVSQYQLTTTYVGTSIGLPTTMGEYMHVYIATVQFNLNLTFAHVK